MGFPWRQSILKEPNQEPIVFSRVTHLSAFICVLVCLRCFPFSLPSSTHRSRIFEHAVCFVASSGVRVFT